MIDEDNGNTVVCPYCNRSEGCKHFLVVLDLTFGEWIGGFAGGKRDLFDGEIVSAFSKKMVANQDIADWDNYTLDELWREASASYDLDDGDIYLEPRPLLELAEELFDSAGAIGLRGVFEGGPGQSSALVAFYAEDPERCFSASVAELKRLLLDDEVNILAQAKIDVVDELRTLITGESKDRIFEEAAKLIEELRQEKRYLEIKVKQADATIEKFIDPENLRAYLKYADDFEESGPYKTLTYEQWFKREYR